LTEETIDDVSSLINRRKQHNEQLHRKNHTQTGMQLVSILKNTYRRSTTITHIVPLFQHTDMALPTLEHSQCSTHHLYNLTQIFNRPLSTYWAYYNPHCIKFCDIWRHSWYT